METSRGFRASKISVSVTIVTVQHRNIRDFFCGKRILSLFTNFSSVNFRGVAKKKNCTNLKIIFHTGERLCGEGLQRVYFKKAMAAQFHGGKSSARE